MLRASALLFLAVLPGCFYLADRGRALESRVDKLGDDNQQLREQLQETREKLAQTSNALKEALEQLDKSSRTTGANIGVRVDGAIQDVAQLRGQLEGHQYKVAELEQKLGQLEVQRAGPQGQDPKADEPKRVEPKWPADPKELLRVADEKLKAGELELARRMYSDFLRRWPRDEQVGEAHAGLGQAWFADGKCPEALYDFGKVITDHKRTKSAPAVYLHSAECFKQARMAPEAKQVLEELVRDFPKSDAAKTARLRLAELEKKPAKKPSGK
jgi:TolA-binding protein